MRIQIQIQVGVRVRIQVRVRVEVEKKIKASPDPAFGSRLTQTQALAHHIAALHYREQSNQRQSSLGSKDRLRVETNGWTDEHDRSHYLFR